jgi:hypothetical protein
VSAASASSMIRRTTAHTEHDDQSETETQSQISEDISGVPQAGLAVRKKARVCTDNDRHWQLFTLE